MNIYPKLSNTIKYIANEIKHILLNIKANKVDPINTHTNYC